MDTVLDYVFVGNLNDHLVKHHSTISDDYSVTLLWLKASLVALYRLLLSWQNQDKRNTTVGVKVLSL